MKKNKTFTAAELAEYIFSQGVSLNLAIQKSVDCLSTKASSIHNRNEIGNAYALALGGALTPADTTTAFKLMMWAKNPEKLKNFKIVSKSGAIYTGEDILNMP